jgi:hypothetical protein
MTTKKRDEQEDIKKIVKLCYISPYLKRSKPVNLMLLAPAESGKTHFLLSFFTKFSRILSDLSFAGLLKILQEDKNLKTIVIPDFLKITGKKQSTKQNLLTILNGFLEEGIYKISLGNREEINLEGRRGSIMTATTRASYNQNKKEWESMGFSSRFLMVSYEYSQQTISEIMQLLASENGKIKKPLKLKGRLTEVTASEEINLRLKEASNNSLRMFQMLMTLSKCNALLDGRDKVLIKDIEEIKRLSKFFNLDYKEI